MTVDLIKSKGQLKDFMIEVSAGRVPGFSRVHKFGRNPTITTSTDPEDVWDVGGLWVPPTVARVHNLVSSLAGDAGTLLSSGTVGAGSSTTLLIDSSATFSSDGVAAGDTVVSEDNFAHATVMSVDSETQITTVTGRHNRAFIEGNEYRVVTPASTGASVVHVKGLDTNMVYQSEFVILNGTSNVATTKSYLRINRMHLDGANGRAANVGNIKATAVTDGTVSAQITAKRGQTLMAIDTIPSNKRGYIAQWSSHMNRSGGATAIADLSLIEVPFASVGGSGERVEDWSGISLNSPVHEMYIPPLPIDPNTDIMVRVEEVSATVDITSTFDLLLEDLTVDTGG